MYGSGLVKGLLVSAKRFMSKKITQKYPEVEPDLPSRSRGSFDFDPYKCISCNMCANACPNGVIRVDSVKDSKGKKVLQKYNMNLGYCMFCGLCVAACPTSALTSSKDFHLACFNGDDARYFWDGPAVKEEHTAEEEAAAALDTESKPAGEV